jgi:acyl dehydratase
LIRNSIRVTGLRMAINYGLNRVRFVSPVPSGSRIRALIVLQAVDAVSDGYQVTWQVTVEREGGEKPACVADWVVRYYPERGQGLRAKG